VAGKHTSPASGLAGFSKAYLVRTYVWEKPVRIAHWLMFFSIASLSFTGLYIHRPFLLSSGHAAFLMATMRFIHVVSGFVLIAAFILRVYWFFKGNFWSRWSAYIPLRVRQWEGIGDMLEFYSFLRFDPGRLVGHNPLAALSYFFVYLIILVEILTGLALYDAVLHNTVLHQCIAWLPMFIEIGYLRLIHFFLMFVIFAFVIFHLYACVLVSLEEQSGLLDSIFSGWKFVPAGTLRKEITSIPEARRFAKRPQLLPLGTTAEKRAGVKPTPRPGPTPFALYRNWTSYIGTGIAAVGVLVFGVLTAYHTIGGGALTQPYGDLVIFFLPPMAVFLGIVVVLMGMWFEWIRWRKNKPLSFARFPQMDLNVASERKALLAVGIGAAIISIPAIYGGQQAYLYTDAVSFCGAQCHSMRPEYATYQRSPHARVECAQCHVAPGNVGYVESKMLGMKELYETVQNNYPRPIPIPVMSLRPVRGNCERCHWPANFFGSRELHRDYFLADEKNTHWEINMLVRIDGGSAVPGASRGIHWHAANKVEYVATDPQLQNIPWVRAVDSTTGVAKVYTNQAQKSSASPRGEIRTMDCVDCHNRPSHIFRAPDQSVNLALAAGRIDASLPFVKQEGVAALAATYANSDQALHGIETTLVSFYQKSYPQIYTEKQQTIRAAIADLQNTYDHYFFPSMKVRWDTYNTDSTHFYSMGCFRCHDGQHKSIDGKVIPAGCNTCHVILQQGKSESLETATGAGGLAFRHPVDIGGIWASQPCSSCHTGGSL
jgi:Ni/Fe-hydrogenase b-type cytochrome subunit